MLVDILKNFSTMLQKVSFWLLLFFLLGSLLGSFCMYKYVDMKLKDSVKLNGIIIGEKVYDLKQRP